MNRRTLRTFMGGERARKVFEYNRHIMQIGRKIVESHCPRGWKFAIENLNNDSYRSADREELAGAGCSLGGTNFVERAISIDFRMVTELRPECEIRDTILHEIAHVLAGKRARHGKRWFQIAEKIGVSEQDLIKNVMLNVQCSRLRREARRYRRRRRQPI